MKKQEPLLVYNLFPLLFGPVTKWAAHFPRIAAMGFNTVYVNPVHLPGFSGSLYAIKDYHRFHPRLVEGVADPEAGFRAMLDAAHRANLRVVVDLVINHSSVDAGLTKAHPDWYRRTPDGELVHPGALDDGKWVEWGDLASFDNEHSSDRKGLWAYWGELVQWLLELGFDGFRADAAYQVPGALWAELITAAKTKKLDAIFLAESLGCTIDDQIALAAAGFDYTFNSAKYWNYRDPWLLTQLCQYLIYVPGRPSVAFAESHDTNRLFAECQGNLDAVKQRLQFTAFWSGGFMITSGLEHGFRVKPHVVRTVPGDWEEPAADLTEYLAILLALKKRYPVLGEDGYVEPVALKDSGDVAALMKTSADRSEKALLLINRDLYNYQRVFAGDLPGLFERPGPVRDISPESRMETVGRQFEYHLRPGQVKVLHQQRGG